MHQRDRKMLTVSGNFLGQGPNNQEPSFSRTVTLQHVQTWATLPRIKRKLTVWRHTMPDWGTGENCLNVQGRVPGANISKSHCSLENLLNIQGCFQNIGTTFQEPLLNFMLKDNTSLLQSHFQELSVHVSYHKISLDQQPLRTEVSASQRGGGQLFQSKRRSNGHAKSAPIQKGGRLLTTPS
jgi:hypothetical protein